MQPSGISFFGEGVPV